MRYNTMTPFGSVEPPTTLAAEISLLHARVSAADNHAPEDLTTVRLAIELPPPELCTPRWTLTMYKAAICSPPFPCSHDYYVVCLYDHRRRSYMYHRREPRRLHHPRDEVDSLLAFIRSALRRSVGARRWCHTACALPRPACAPGGSTEDGRAATSSRGGRRPRADAGSRHASSRHASRKRS